MVAVNPKTFRQVPAFLPAAFQTPTPHKLPPLLCLQANPTTDDKDALTFQAELSKCACERAKVRDAQAGSPFALAPRLLLLTCCLFGNLLGQSSSSLSVGAAMVAGNTATVPLSFASGTGTTAGVAWGISVPGSTSVSVQAGSASTSAGKAIYCNGATCLVSGDNENAIPNGALANLAVTFPASASGTFQVQLTSAAEGLINGTAGVISTTNGTITVSPAPAPPALSGVQCATTTLAGGQSSSCSVTLTASAPTGGTTIALSSSSAAVSVPASVAVPAGSSSAKFTAVAGQMTAAGTAIITAASNGISKQTTLVLTPSTAISSLQCAEATLFSGATTTCTVNMTGPVLNPTPINLSAQNAYLTVPATVSIPAGSVSASFPAVAGVTSAPSSVMLTARSASGLSTVFAFTILPLQTLLIEGSATEISGTTVGSVVTPHVAPPGFTGSVVAKGTGSINFSPITGGDGVYFLNCCSNENNAYYKFTGSQIGTIFNVNEGQISFYLKSRYSFAQRSTTAAALRYAFDVRDGNGHMFYFLTEGVSGKLVFSYMVGKTVTNYFVPSGSEDSIFGNGVVLKVTVAWNGTVANLYLNDTLVDSSSYTPPTPNWTAASTFDLGSYEYLTFGGYNTLDDAIADFSVAPITTGTNPAPISNPAAPPVISKAGASSITSLSATIGWSTDKASSSQVAYGTVFSSEAVSAIDPTPVTSHSVVLSGLLPATTYHYQAQSMDALGNLAVSTDLTFTTPGTTGPQLLFELHGSTSEITGVSNGSIATPSVGPVGFAGSVVANGTGSVNFAPNSSGSGVYFRQCCTNDNRAYLKFTGTGVGKIFGGNQGAISFYLKSRYSFAQRQASAPSPRFAFDVRDGNNDHLFYFLTQVASGYLQFSYVATGAGLWYDVPAGKEDALFGEGITLKVTLTWDGSAVKLYLNDALAQSTPTTPIVPSWTAAAVFDIGAYEYASFGGYNSLDDIVEEFTVSPVVNP